MVSRSYRSSLCVLVELEGFTVNLQLTADEGDVGRISEVRSCVVNAGI